MRQMFFVAALVLPAFYAGCTKSDGDAETPKPTEASTTETAAPAKHSTAPEPETFAIPEGAPEELFAFLQGLSSEEPAGRDQESMRAFYSKLGHTVVKTADQILAGKPTKEQTEEAFQYKLEGLMLLDQIGDPSVAATRAAMPEALKAAGLDSLIRFVTLHELLGRLRQLGAAEPKEIQAFADELAKFFEESTPEPQEAGLAMQVSGLLKQALKAETAAIYLERFGKVFSKLEDEQAAEMGAVMLGMARQIRLVGQEMPLEGLTLDGEELQWDAYRGKVVLVDFWATWCPPCIEEIANIRQNYDKYHDQGFDVVGISADKDRGALVAFQKTNKLPWAILCDYDLERADREMMSTRYGVTQFPTVMLVGKDGKVIAMDPRGPELGRRLEELLGPPAETPKEPAESK